MSTPAPRHPHTRHRRHPAALPPAKHDDAQARLGNRPRPQTIEEAKLNLRVAAASRSGSASGGDSGSLAGDLASSAIRFAKDHPAALATGIGVVALVVGPGAIIKGAATAARLATVAGFLGKAAK
ncbi:MAG: hypothetical protein NCW75_06355 [Phycisphaera sp.]|nr:MAG: hypothetical protein NCW75_06355 [Phycisphaera sp.]